MKRRTPVFTYIVAVAMLLLGAFGAVRGMQLSLSLLLVAIAVTMFIGLGQPLYRAAIYRKGSDELLCRFAPWYQSTHLATSVMFPVIGIATIVQGNEADNPFWVFWLGVMAFAMGCALALSALLAWRVNHLVITPSALAIRVIFRQQQHIPRECVQAITGRVDGHLPNGAPKLHIDLSYLSADSSGDGIPATIRQLEGQFTINPANLLEALSEWSAADPTESGLMDRVEAILRSRLTVAKSEEK